MRLLRAGVVQRKCVCVCVCLDECVYTCLAYRLVCVMATCVHPLLKCVKKQALVCVVCQRLGVCACASLYKCPLPIIAD